MKKNILLFFVSLFAFLLIAEIAFRVNGKYATYAEQIGVGGYISPYSAFQPNWYLVFPVHTHVQRNSHEFTVSWQSNNEGLNDTDFLIPKTKKRILILGDSFTEGIGANNDSCLPKQLSYFLSDSFNQNTEVWNCGISGSDPIYEFRLFNDRLLKYKPDMAIVVLNNSDIYEALTRGGFERFKSDSTVEYNHGPWYEPIYARSYFIRRIVHDALKYNWQFIPEKDLTKTKQLACNNLTAAMDSFVELSKKANIRLLFVFLPTSMDGEMTWNGKRAVMRKYQMEPLIQYCITENISFVEVGQEIIKQGIDSSNFYKLRWKEDGHFNNKGYGYIAKCIWKRVAEELND